MSDGLVCRECGEIIFSRYRHDFKFCGCGNVSIDGGSDYLKIGFTDEHSFYAVELNSKQKQLGSITTISESEIEYIAHHIRYDQTVYDPMAGTGGIAKLQQLTPVRLTCKEIETEWINTLFSVDRWYAGSSTVALQTDEKFDWIVMEPPNGDRKSDHANFSKSRNRHTYQEALGKRLQEDNVARMNWGPKYKETMEKIYTALRQNIGPETGFILILAGDHGNKSLGRNVMLFHLKQIKELGFEIEDSEKFNNEITPFNRDDGKLIYILRRQE